MANSSVLPTGGVTPARFILSIYPVIISRNDFWSTFIMKQKIHGLPSWLAHGLSLLVGIGSITYFTILLGELFPKTLALQNPQKVALMLTGSFFIFTKLFYPFVGLLTRGTHILLDLFTFKSSESKKLTDADLKSLLSLAYNQGTIEERELKLHENIFTVYDLLVNQIM